VIAASTIGALAVVVAAQLAPGDPTPEEQQHASRLIGNSFEAWKALHALSSAHRVADGCKKDADCAAHAIAVGCDSVVLALGPRAAKNTAFQKALREITSQVGPAPECTRPSEVPLPVCRVVDERKQCAFVDVDFRSDIVSHKEQVGMRWMRAQYAAEVMKTTWLAGPVARRLRLYGTSAAFTPERAAQLIRCLGEGERTGQLTLTWTKSYQPHIQVLGDEITQVNNTLQVRAEARPYIDEEQRQCLHRAARAWPVVDSAEIVISIGWH
jgi:hypothetical protein